MIHGSRFPDKEGSGQEGTALVIVSTYQELTQFLQAFSQLTSSEPHIKPEIRDKETEALSVQVACPIAQAGTAERGLELGSDFKALALSRR